MTDLIQARVLVSGSAEGEAIVTTEPLSFWGGFDARSGEIIDRRHPLSGTNVSRKIFVFPHGRGSSSGSGLLLEGIRLGTAPAAIILAQTDQIIALGTIVGRELYQKSIPVVVVSPADYARLQDARYVRVSESGQVTWD